MCGIGRFEPDPAFRVRRSAVLARGHAHVLAWSRALLFLLAAGPQAIAQTVTAPDVTGEGSFPVEVVETTTADPTGSKTGGTDSGKSGVASSPSNQDPGTDEVVQPDADLSLASPSPYVTVSTEASSPTFDRAALEALYRDADGDNWDNNDNWLTTARIGLWYGVTTNADGLVVSLNLPRNGLNGSIPAELGSLAVLETLVLSENLLSGAIPAELGHLANLGTLDLFGNQLSGAIPAELGNLASLESLRLEHNGLLSGAIPPELGNLANLKRLQLADNRLSGAVPAELGNLANLEAVYFSSNRLSGTVPPELGNLANLRILLLTDNRLTGAIPPELSNLANVEWLSLARNQLNGTIPAELGSLANVLRLDLGSNRLNGTIPPELGNLDDLLSVYLSGNRLTGCVPAGLRDVPVNDFGELGLPFCGGGDPQVEAGFGQASYTVAEGGSVVVDVLLSADPERTIEIPLTVDEQDGASSADYSGIPDKLTFNNADTPRSFTFTTTDDTAKEDDESVRLGLGLLPAGVALGSTNEATVFIADDDSPNTNRPPVATDEIPPQVLDVGDRARLDAADHFRDPEQRIMSFEAVSADPSVATVALERGVVTINGVGHGVTEATVSALDHRRARAEQTFEVTVGRQLSFKDAELSVAEGETAMLTVAINRTREVATTLGYVIGEDADPATAEADSADHDGRAGTITLEAGASETVIAIHVRDDMDIEPAREAFTVTLRVSDELQRHVGLDVATARVVINEGVCDRTPQVRDALCGSLPCASVSETDLAGRRTLDLSRTDVSSLKSADLAGLVRLRVLDLSGNALAVLPERVFAGLGALEEVRLQNNPGAPFTLRLELVRIDAAPPFPGPATIRARVREGAPFPVRAELVVDNGILSSDGSSNGLAVSTGMTQSAAVRVVRESEGTTRMRIASTPVLPAARCGPSGAEPCVRGIALAAGVPLTLFRDPPEVTRTVENTELAAEGDSLTVDLSELFANSDGSPLSYRAWSDDPALATVTVRGGILDVTSVEGGLEGSVTVTVAATDLDEQTATLTFEVTIWSMPRGFVRGWRSVLLDRLREERQMRGSGGGVQ